MLSMISVINTKNCLNVNVMLTNMTSALEVFLNDMRCINPRFTYLLTYLFNDFCGF